MKDCFRFIYISRQIINEYISHCNENISHCNDIAVNTVKIFLIFKDFYLYIFREKVREGKRTGEGHRCARDILINCFSHAPNWGSGPQPRHVPYLGIKHSDGLVCRPVLVPLSHTSLGNSVVLMIFVIPPPQPLQYLFFLGWAEHNSFIETIYIPYSSSM